MIVIFVRKVILLRIVYARFNFVHITIKREYHQIKTSMNIS